MCHVGAVLNMEHLQGTIKECLRHHPVRGICVNTEARPQMHTWKTVCKTHTEKVPSSLCGQTGPLSVFFSPELSRALHFLYRRPCPCVVFPQVCALQNVTYMYHRAYALWVRLLPFNVTHWSFPVAFTQERCFSLLSKMCCVAITVFAYASILSSLSCVFSRWPHLALAFRTHWSPGLTHPSLSTAGKTAAADGLRVPPCQYLVSFLGR